MEIIYQQWETLIKQQPLSLSFSLARKNKSAGVFAL
jgi:hypothetical protein